MQLQKSDYKRTVAGCEDETKQKKVKKISRHWSSLIFLIKVSRDGASAGSKVRSYQSLLVRGKKDEA